LRFFAAIFSGFGVIGRMYFDFWWVLFGDNYIARANLLLSQLSQSRQIISQRPNYWPAALVPLSCALLKGVYLSRGNFFLQLMPRYRRIKIGSTPA